MKAALHDESGDAASALGLVGHGEHHEHVGHIAVGDEDLGAVEDVVVPVQLGLGLALGGIGAGVGLGQAEGADLAAGGQHGQVLGLLGLGAVHDDGIAAQAVVGGHDVAGGGALLGQLLDADGAGQGIGAGAAVLLGHAHAHHAQVEQLLDGLPGILAGLVGLGSDGLHFILGEFRHHLPDQLVLTAEIEIHDVFSLYINLESATMCKMCRRACFQKMPCTDPLRAKHLRPPQRRDRRPRQGPGIAMPQS